MKTYKDPIILKSDAIALAGSASELSRVLGVNRANVSLWGEKVPTVWAYRLVQIYPELKKTDFTR